MCRHLRQIVTDDESIQLKLGLASAGMVVNPLRDEPTAARLEHLRTYVDAWAHNDFTEYLTHDLNQRGYRAGLGEAWWPPTGGMLPCLENEYLVLVRPASASRGIPEKIWWMTNLDVKRGRIRAVGVDLSQDLLVVIRDFRGCVHLSLVVGDVVRLTTAGLSLQLQRMSSGIYIGPRYSPSTCL